MNETDIIITESATTLQSIFLSQYHRALLPFLYEITCNHLPEKMKFHSVGNIFTNKVSFGPPICAILYINTLTQSKYT